MKRLLKYWKLLIALILIGAALFLYFDVYKTEAAAYETESRQLEAIIQTLEATIQRNLKYKDIQDELEEAKVELDASRKELYEHFPVEMREEDQVMYILYLETLFGTEIQFSFNQAQPLTVLSDGTNLMGLLMPVNYETTYEGFQDMVDYLATDNRVASVYEATIAYDADQDIAAGTITLILYLMNSEELAEGYTPPDVAIPEIGKDNIFE